MWEGLQARCSCTSRCATAQRPTDGLTPAQRSRDTAAS
ncbi:hypothetical protein GLE_5207 [Lysobacter enzymogenes]|uniref:Uncharacterized protein n=1 Tax=Lysobacter enzymogenes TaxID=69 RepID=A0A0S2DPN8_LYSEN|nr:hypothetical protein GLE_5207 [Lysobacter enzymogenes]